MKVIVIGGGGTIGGPVADALSARHEVVRVGRRVDEEVDIGGDRRGLRPELAREGRVGASLQRKRHRHTRAAQAVQ